MPQFESFSKNLGALKLDPQVTLTRRGTLSLNKSAHTALGSPGAVELLYDLPQRIVGLRAIDARADNAYFVRPMAGDRGPFVISVMAFTKFYDIDTTQSLRWSAHLDEGILCIDLNDAATPVTSNRARDRQPGADDHRDDVRALGEGGDELFGGL